MTVPTLTAMVVGSMVGAGVFSLPRRFSEETGAAGALIAWAVAGTGMLMLAFVFQALAVRRPDLDAGVYAYAKAGFGEYLGFFSAVGYWASACLIIYAPSSVLFVMARREQSRRPFSPGEAVILAVSVDDDTVAITFGTSPVVLPEPLAGLIRELVATRRGKAKIGTPDDVP
ncbi:amino acid permease [Streptomyces sp. NPDC001890]|uniref:amino acid permease n=1 Tax=Streptomyces sp. NPDC001890 TaxID=3364620 RepID=UPI0036933C02